MRVLDKKRYRVHRGKRSYQHDYVVLDGPAERGEDVIASDNGRRYKVRIRPGGQFAIGRKWTDGKP